MLMLFLKAIHTSLALIFLIYKIEIKSHIGIMGGFEILSVCEQFTEQRD